MVAMNEGNLKQDLEESHDLLSLKKLNDDIFYEFSNNRMRKACKVYYCKYPNCHAHTTEEKAIEAGKLAAEMAGVAFEDVGSRDVIWIGNVDSEKVYSIDDYNIWNRLNL